MHFSKTKLFTWIKKKKKIKEQQSKKEGLQLTTAKTNLEMFENIYKVRGEKADFYKGVLVLHMFSIQMHHIVVLLTILHKI